MIGLGLLQVTNWECEKSNLHQISNILYMKRIRLTLFLLILCTLAGSACHAQTKWSLVRDNDWIKVYETAMDHSNFKRIKVECTVEGTYDKLLQILNNVSNHKSWIYNTKDAHIIERISGSEYYYYTETTLPWPLQNRDAVVHIKFIRDSLDRYLKIAAVGEPDFMPIVRGKIRVPRSANTWMVTMPAPNTLNIVYIFEADPGGSLPSWLVNAFVDKGPYESFRKLAEQLKR